MNSRGFLSILHRHTNIKHLSRFQFKRCFTINNKDQHQDNVDLRHREKEFIQQGNIDFKDIHLNPENIKRRQEAQREMDQTLDKYKLKKPNQFYDPQNNPNPTGHVFNFHEEDLLQKQGRIQIYGLANGYFTANDVWYPGSILAFPKQVFLWDVQTAADIRPHSFDIIEFIKPTPRYIIVGTGKDKYPLEDSIFKKFRDQGVKVDVIPTFEACSTFNVCNEDGLNICAFMIPANL